MASQQEHATVGQIKPQARVQDGWDPSTHPLTCDGVVMVGRVGEGLQQVGLVLKGVADLSFKVLKAGDEMVECVLCVGVVQHAAGWDLQPAVAQIASSAPMTLRCSRHSPLLQRQHLRAAEDT